MPNPFCESTTEITDEELLAAWRAGDCAALETLLCRHRPWILNLAVRLLARRQDAEDVTQEALLRALRGLASFRGESRFRTWLYRVAVNTILNHRDHRWAAADAVCSFAAAAQGLAMTPDLDPPDPRTVPVPFELLVAEAGIGCLNGTLLCLDGRQRLVFVLGEIFGVGDDVGSEIVGVTPVNFRQILSRARRDLYQYLHDNCSLVNPGASCRCARKTQAFVRSGFVDPASLTFTAEHRRKVHDLVPARSDELGAAFEQVAAQLYRGHPFYETADQVALIRQALATVSLPG